MPKIARWLCLKFCPDLLRARTENHHLRRIAAALAGQISLNEMADLVAEECKIALSADSTCIFLAHDNNSYEMYGERGCTEAFKLNWKYIPEAVVARMNAQDGRLIMASADHLKQAFPEAAQAIETSGRKIIAYARMQVNGRPIGILAFAYDRVIDFELDRDYVLTIIDFCAQALERVRLTEREQLNRQQAEAANRAKTAFLANVSHEIRTPIGVIQGFADLLLESGGLTTTQRHWASVIRRNTQQLTGIIGEVLDISKIEAEKIEIENIGFSLKELLADVRTTAEFKAREKGIQFLFECGEVPEWVRSDPTRLRQILVNLVGNAIKFTVQGHVKVRVNCNLAGRLEVEVRDTGIGISPESQLTVFDPFIQADTSTRRCFGGTGLGLTIAKRLAKALGGDVCLKESIQGRGSVFIFHMDCQREDSPEARELQNESHRECELEGLRILLVEDSPDNQDLICSLLAREGASVDVVDSGIMGVKKALEENYNVVLMDIQMPGLDGHEAVARLRAQGYNRPIAALTAHALSSERLKSLREGFDDYLTKPIDRVRLIRSLKRLGYLGAS